jgi:hypothetical protein
MSQKAFVGCYVLPEGMGIARTCYSLCQTGVEVMGTNQDIAGFAGSWSQSLWGSASARETLSLYLGLFLGGLTNVLQPRSISVPCTST